MHMNMKNSAGPSRAASPALAPMPMGPDRFLGDMRRSSIPFMNCTINSAPFPLAWTDSRNAAGSERFVVMRRSFCCGITPIIQRAGASTLENTGCTVITWDCPSR